MPCFVCDFLYDYQVISKLIIIIITITLVIYVYKYVPNSYIVYLYS